MTEGRSMLRPLHQFLLRFTPLSTLARSRAPPKSLSPTTSAPLRCPWRTKRLCATSCIRSSLTKSSLFRAGWKYTDGIGTDRRSVRCSILHRTDRTSLSRSRVYRLDCPSHDDHRFFHRRTVGAATRLVFSYHSAKQTADREKTSCCSKDIPAPRATPSC